MRYLIIITLLLLCGSKVFCQTNDWGKVWINGAGTTFQTTFQPSPINIILDSTKYLYFSIGHSNICDSSGQLILCSDGYNVYDKNMDFLDGGDTLCPVEIYNWQDGFSTESQASMFLPMGNNKYYFLNTVTSDSMMFAYYDNPTPVDPYAYDLLLYNLIDMNANGGAGKVVKRMKTAINNAEPGLSMTQMMACRHGNGRDWWVLKQAQDTNVVFKLLFTPDSVYGPYIQSFAEPHFSFYSFGGQSMFSQDGTKYASTCRAAFKVFVADFDRCTGELSNPQVYDKPAAPFITPDSTVEYDPFTEGLAFSPNGRFIYVNGYYSISQLDLDDSNPATQWSVVAGLDTTWAAFQSYSCMYLGPDDKLYVGNFGGLSGQMSRFDNPDQKGLASDFCPRCLRFPAVYYPAYGTYFNTAVSAPPTMPNYKLGAGGPCATGIEEVKEETRFVVYPNPTNGSITVEFTEAGTFTITDAVGRTVYSERLPVGANKQTIPLSGLSPGVYVYRYIAEGRQPQTGKLIVSP